jgi:hypothetical protein
MRRRIIIAALVIAFVPLLLFVAAVVYPYAENRLRSQPFQPSVWRDEPTKDTRPWPTRLRMVDDLIASRELIGIARADVLNLLGPADDVTFFRETSRRGDDAEWDLGYKLGPERGKWMRVDNEWLLLDLNDQGRVERVLVTHD